MNSNRISGLQSRRNQILEKLGVFGRNHAISPELCTHYFELMRTAAASPAEVLRTDATVLVDEKTRRTLSVQIPDDDQQRIRSVFAELMPDLSAHFGLNLTTYEEPQYLRYGPGSFFTAHRDRP